MDAGNDEFMEYIVVYRHDLMCVSRHDALVRPKPSRGGEKGNVRAHALGERKVLTFVQSLVDCAYLLIIG